MKKQKASIFAEKIFYYESVIESPKALVDSIEQLDLFEKNKKIISGWNSWTSSEGSYVFGKKKSTDKALYDQSSLEAQRVYDVLSSTISFYGQDYADTLSVPLGVQMPISISKYFSGTFMGPHTDSSPQPTTENISAVLYLNDDYDGGDLNFPEQGVKIKPKAGSLVVFPSVPPFYHESLLITSGTKYLSPAFWHLYF
jgi:Rps23 Pro-64 3,4-dihydroxylase Tpa1-like proline 4-hydroxylase